ncbi:MAG TPA: mechanosensitive ion channel domain-containing protein [Myxococcales bacterium]|nr:mechanosensitive ion channel domain-containing protein [Myxococcales bacterium]
MSSILSLDLRPRHIIVALVLVALAIGLNRFIQMAFRRAVERQRQRGTLTPEIATQLSLTRGVVGFAIWAIAISMALAQFPELRVLSTGLLASAGVSGIIVGFAAQGTLGNAIAGVTISLAQPIRLGDDVEIKGERGIVEDIHFIFTVVRLGDGRRMIIPNSTVANEVIKNATMGGVTRVARVDALVPPGGHAEAVRTAMLEAANSWEALDRGAGAPEVYFVRVDERGTLLRLVATCTDAAAADKLGQKALKRASETAFRRALGG